MENAIAITENKPLTKVQVVAQKRLIQEVMEAVMIGPSEKNPAGVHYGIIPGCKLPSLFKAGSEALLSTFRIAVEPTVEDLSTRDSFRYRVTLRGIIPSGEIVGAGVGEASTDEEKYHWRGAVCDKEYDTTPDDRRRIKYGKPTSWNKEGETKQVRTNPADLANTVLKMAKKRAQIDLTLTALGCSDVFAQDLEDLPEELREELTRDGGTQKQGKPAVKAPQSKQTYPPANDAPVSDKPITEAQGKMLYAKMKNSGVESSDFFAHFGITRLGELPSAKMVEALDAIGSGKIASSKSTTTYSQPPLEVCNNCGETLDADGNGHHPDCPNGE